MIDPTKAVEETAQFSAIATLFLFLGLAISGFTSASQTHLDYVWRNGGTGKSASPTGVIVGFVIVGLCYMTAACLAGYVAYYVTTVNFLNGDLEQNEKARVKLLKQRLASLR